MIDGINEGKKWVESMDPSLSEEVVVGEGGKEKKVGECGMGDDDGDCENL